MSDWRWVAADIVYAIHERQLDEHGGLDGVRDSNSVQSALARPQHLAAYEEPDGAALAACYTFGLARSHGFSDGNKRIAWVVARLFLADNGFSLRFDPLDAIRTMVDVASGTISEEQLASCFRKRLSP